MDYTWSFSFVMPAHDVLISATTQEGRYVYTPQQFADIDEQQGTFYLVRVWRRNPQVINIGIPACGTVCRRV